MSTRLDSSNYLGPTLWWRNLTLRWPIGLAIAGLTPFFLPIPETSPATLAAFAVVMLSLVVLARSWLIAALPVLATIGPHCLPIAAFGVSIFGFRLLLMLLAVFSTPLSTRAKWWFNPVARWAIFFGAFWLLYALLSLFWAPNLAVDWARSWRSCSASRWYWHCSASRRTGPSIWTSCASAG